SDIYSFSMIMWELISGIPPFDMNAKLYKWNRRKNATGVIGRLYMVQPIEEQLWNTHKLALCEDILYNVEQLTPSQTIILNDTIENEALNQIEHYLQSNGMSLKNFPHMPIPSIQNIHSNFANNNLDQLIYEERSYDTIYLIEQVCQNVPLLNKKQHLIYNKIIQAINNECENIITLPSDITIHKGTLTNLIDFIYPDLIENSDNANYMVSKAILTPKNINVEIISDIIMKRIPDEVILYPSADLVNLPDDSTVEQTQTYLPEFLRSLKIPELPPGELKPRRLSRPHIPQHTSSLITIQPKTSSFNNSYTSSPRQSATHRYVNNNFNDPSPSNKADLSRQSIPDHITPHNIIATRKYILDLYRN
ncbi:4915_t:CDS:2, partial [Funneliformis geosporum]